MNTINFIEPCEVDLDGGIALSLIEPPSILTASIQSVGIIEPPVLLQNEGKLTPITGVQRLKAALLLDLDRIPAIILKNQPFEKATLMAVYANISGRGLRPIEEALYLVRLKDYLSREDLLSVLSLFDLPQNMEITKECEALSRMSPQTLKQLANTPFSWSTIRRLLAWDQTTIEVILNLFSKIHLSVSKERILLDYLEDIAGQSGCTVLEILQDEKVTNILKMQNPTQRGNLLLDLFRKKCFPRLVNMETRYQSLISQITLPKGVSLTPPPYFEGKKYKLTAAINTIDQLKQLANDIAKLAEEPVMASILDL